MGYGIITPASTSIIDQTLAFQQALSVCGLVQTADTGQWDGVSEPTTSSYLMYMFNDAFSSTYPVYLKFMSFSDKSTEPYKCPIMLESIGYSTNGAGTFIGSKAIFGRTSYSSAFGIFGRILYSYNSSGLYITLDSGWSSSYAFCVERALNQDGTVADSQGEIGCFNFPANNTESISVTHKPNGFEDRRIPTYPVLGNNPYVTNTGLSTVMPYYFFGESRPWQSNLMSVGNTLNNNTSWRCITNGTSKYYEQKASTHDSNRYDYHLGIGYLPGMLWE